jgi:serine/threonine-protein kinase RsbT
MSADVVVAIRIDSDIVEARQKGRLLAQQVGLSTTDQTLVATAISELARNILKYAGTGEILLGIERLAGRHGVVVTARDRGPGIADIERAMQDGFSTAGGLGLGLPGAKRLMDEFSIDSAPGRGTTIVMKKWGRGA